MQLDNARPNDFALGDQVNVAAHKQPGYAIVNISLKPESAASPAMRAPTQMRPDGRSRRAVLASTSCASPTRRTSCCRMSEGDLYALWQRS
jgi:hypothetical protein